MISLHSNILSRNGKKEFTILPFEEFEQLNEIAEKYEDLIILRKAKAEAEKCHLATKSFSEEKKILDI